MLTHIVNVDPREFVPLEGCHKAAATHYFSFEKILCSASYFLLEQVPSGSPLTVQTDISGKPSLINDNNPDYNSLLIYGWGYCNLSIIPRFGQIQNCVLQISLIKT